MYLRTGGRSAATQRTQEQNSWTQDNQASIPGIRKGTDIFRCTHTRGCFEGSKQRETGAVQAVLIPSRMISRACKGSQHTEHCNPFVGRRRLQEARSFRTAEHPPQRTTAETSTTTSSVSLFLRNGTDAKVCLARTYVPSSGLLPLREA